MSDTKVSDLSALAASVRGDLLYTVNDPTGTPASKSVQVEDVLGKDIIVAASDAPASWKRHAYAVCDGTNDEVEIQAALDALPSEGQGVFLSPGNYLLSYAGSTTADGVTTLHCVEIDASHPALTISGVRGATILKLADSQTIHTAIISIRGTEASPRPSATRITGLQFDGNSANQSAWTKLWGSLQVLYTSNVVIDHNDFTDANKSGLHVFRLSQKATIAYNNFTCHGAMVLENNYHFVIGNVFEDSNNDDGTTNVLLLPDYDAGDYSHLSSILIGNQFIGSWNQLYLDAVSNTTILGNSFANQNYGSGYCLKMQGDPSSTNSIHNLILGNTFYNFINGIYLKDDGGGIKGCLYNTIANNNFIDGPDRNVNYGVRITGSITGYNRIINNDFDPNINSPNLVSVTTTDEVRGNQGYVTENKGAASNISDGGTIAHSCADTPTVAWVQASVAGEMASVTGIDGTNITVAIKQDDGSAGTQQTIYWKAEV